MSDLQIMILHMIGAGLDVYETASMLKCKESYVRATVSRERKRLELKAFQEAVAAMDKAHAAQ